MSLPSHRLPLPVSQTVGGASAAAAAAGAGTSQLSDVHVAENSSVGDRFKQRQTGQGTPTTVVEPSIPTSRQMLPSKQASMSTTRATAVTADSKRSAFDIPRLMRPQSVLRTYMKYLTPYEQQEIFNYPQVERKRNAVPGYLCSVIVHPRMWHIYFRSHRSICLSVCTVRALTFESLDLETSFLVCRYILTIRIGQQSRN